MILTSAVIAGAVGGVAMDAVDATAVVLIHQKLKARKERTMNEKSTTTTNESNSATKHFLAGTKITGVKSGRVLRALGKGIFTTDLADIGSVAKGAVVNTAHGVGELKHGMTDGRAERKARKQERQLEEAKALLVTNGLIAANAQGVVKATPSKSSSPRPKAVAS